MLLEDYLNANISWLTREHMAYRCGIHRATLNRIAHGIVCPTLIVAYRIVEYTRGEVSYTDLLTPYLAKHSNEFLEEGIILTGPPVKGPKKK